MAVYIRVDRRAQCDDVLTAALHCCLCSLPTQVRFLPYHERSPNRLHRKHNLPCAAADRRTLNPNTIYCTT